MFDKPINTQSTIHELLAKRWSGRAFDAERAVKKQDILALLEAARWSPSCFGDEPWRLLVCDKHDDSSAWAKAYDCLSAGNQGWAKNVPVLIVAVAGTLLRRGGANRWGSYDTGAAMMSVCIQAAALNLMCHQMGGFDMDKAISSFAIPENYLPMSVMAVGYQLPKEHIPAALADRELAERRRTALAENFFSGTWGEPYPV